MSTVKVPSIVRRPQFWLASAGLLVLAASDLLSRGVRTFWGDHQMVSSIVSSVALLAVGSAVLQAWSRDTQAERRRRVSDVAFADLARLTRILREDLWMCLSGEPPDPEGIPEQHPCLEALRSSMSATLPPATDRQARLDALLQNDSWVTAAFQVIRYRKEVGADYVSRWTPVLLTTGDLDQVLLRCSDLISAFAELQRPMQAIHRPAGSGIPEADRRRCAARLFTEVMIACIRFEEDLLRTPANPNWTSRPPGRLTADAIHKLESQDMRHTPPRARSDADMLRAREDLRAMYPSTSMLRQAGAPPA